MAFSTQWLILQSIEKINPNIPQTKTAWQAAQTAAFFHDKAPTMLKKLMKVRPA